MDFVDNYDATMKEPKLLPVTYPGILVNANMGIAEMCIRDRFTTMPVWPLPLR